MNLLNDFLRLLLFIVIIMVIWFIYSYNHSNIVSYYINGDNDFCTQVRKILARSGWRKKYRIYETSNPEEAIITINLTSRKDMDIWHDDPQYYPSGKQIRFSITIQDKTEKPEIFIDQDNWQNGVPESGLTLEQYREYVINHEFGHGLGYDHQPCAGMEKPQINSKLGNILCPVMYQMTRGVPDGGKPNYQVIDQDFTKRLDFRYKEII